MRIAKAGNLQTSLSILFAPQTLFTISISLNWKPRTTLRTDAAKETYLEASELTFDASCFPRTKLRAPTALACTAIKWCYMAGASWKLCSSEINSRNCPKFIPHLWTARIQRSHLLGRSWHKIALVQFTNSLQLIEIHLLHCSVWVTFTISLADLYYHIYYTIICLRIYENAFTITTTDFDRNIRARTKTIINKCLTTASPIGDDPE